MLYEESLTYARSEEDVGCIPSLQMTINLTDDIPVQRSYASVLKPLYKKLKNTYKIFKTIFPYSVTCVRKNMGQSGFVSTICPHWRPLPRIQDLTDTLTGWTQLVFNLEPRQSLPSRRHSRGIATSTCLHCSMGSLWVYMDSLRLDQCIGHISKRYRGNIGYLERRILHPIPGWHTLLCQTFQGHI